MTHLRCSLTWGSDTTSPEFLENWYKFGENNRILSTLFWWRNFQMPPPPLDSYSNERFSLYVFCAVLATINGLCYYNFTIVLICCGKSNPFASVMARLDSFLSLPHHSQTLSSHQFVVRTKQAAISTRCFLMSLKEVVIKLWKNYFRLHQTSKACKTFALSTREKLNYKTLLLAGSCVKLFSVKKLKLCFLRAPNETPQSVLELRTQSSSASFICLLI